jgi:hypothetical protein
VVVVQQSLAKTAELASGELSESDNAGQSWTTSMKQISIDLPRMILLYYSSEILVNINQKYYQLVANAQNFVSCDSGHVPPRVLPTLRPSRARPHCPLREARYDHDSALGHTVAPIRLYVQKNAREWLNQLTIIVTAMRALNTRAVGRDLRSGQIREGFPESAI